MASWLENEINKNADFEMVTPRTLSLVCFRYKPDGAESIEELNAINERILHTANQTGKIFITHTKLNGIYTLRMVIGQTNVKPVHVEKAWKLIREVAERPKGNY